MTTDLTTRIEALDTSVDYTDPNTYAALLYGNEPAATTPNPSEGVTETTAPAAAPAPTPAVAAPAPAAATESSATPAAAPSPASEVVDGVLTKDGKRVIPFAVLEETRKTAQASSQRAKDLAAANERMQAELEALRAGKATTSAPAPAGVYTADRIEEVRADFPEMAELMESHNRMQSELQSIRQAAPAPAPASTEADATAVRIQSLIDQRPLLAEWQAQGSAMWEKACALDNELREDPAWSTKSEADRFAAVEASIAARYGLTVPSTPPAPTPAAAPAAPTPPAIQQAAPVLPTLSDFGGTPVAVGDPLAGLRVGQMVDAAMNMDMEQIRRMAGLPY